MAVHNETGKQGEILAVAYFEQNGYRILHRNWRHRNWEIDIIAEKNGMLHFIEVKTVTSLLFGYPEEKVDNKKLRCLINASEEFLHQQPQWQRIRFDILSITMLPSKPVDYFLIGDVYLF